MTGRTHLAAGVASALVFTTPQSINELIFCFVGASIGSLICDIDVKTTKSHKTADRILSWIVSALIIISYIEYRWKFGIFSGIQKDSDVIRLIMGLAFFIMVCGYGKEQPHRSFMHSIMALSLLTTSVYLSFPKITLYFFVAMTSHILLDMINYTNVRLLYPLKGGISFNLCHAKGYTNDGIRHIAILIIWVECILFATNY